MLFGAPDFFEPRYFAPWCYRDGALEATSFYSTAKLKSTLERFVDFDRINNSGMRFSAGAVNVRTGNFVYFDNRHRVIRAEHVMASGSLPPGFSATEIDGEFYWDGGLVSNTPLQWVVDAEVRQDTLAFQVDLWPAQGALPRNLADVTARQKEIQYSSRTRAGTDQFRRIQRVRGALADLLAKLPKELRNAEETAVLREVAGHNAYNIVHLIYRATQHERHSRDYEFSRLAMREHWQAGYQDASHTLRHKQVLERPTNKEGVFTFDLLKEGDA
jgi:NTE family protein